MRCLPLLRGRVSKSALADATPMRVEARPDFRNASPARAGVRSVSSRIEKLLRRRSNTNRSHAFRSEPRCPRGGRAEQRIATSAVGYDACQTAGRTLPRSESMRGGAVERECFQCGLIGDCPSKAWQKFARKPQERPGRSHSLDHEEDKVLPLYAVGRCRDRGRKMRFA
jgi:hypothetical protein